MLNTKFSPWPSFSTEEAKKITQVLLSNEVNYWTGQEGREFEREFAAYFETDYAIAVANGTLALDLALVALGIGANNGGSLNDEVIVTPRTFLASASSIVIAGAKPVFADIDLNSQNITAQNISKVYTENTRAVIAVHLGGFPCEMDDILAFAEEKGIYVIEDCAQAHGAKYKGRSVGSIGHIGCWSFCQDKIMSTGGEGGMVTTNDEKLWSKMWSYKDHGKSWDAIYNKEHPPGFRWLHDSFGTNWRLTEIQSAIGRIQLKKMSEWTLKRNNHQSTIWESASSLRGIRVPYLKCNSCSNYSNCDGNGCSHAAYKCYVFIEPHLLKSGWDRDRIMTEINKKGVPCFSGTCSEVYLEKAFDKIDSRPITRLPAAKLLGEISLMFLVHPTLTNEEIKLTCDVLKQVMNEATV